MKKNEVKIGGLYHAKVSDRLVTIRIDSAHTRSGWNATNTRTGKRIHIKSAQRLRGDAGGPEKKTEAPEALVDDDEKAEAPVVNDDLPTQTGKAKTTKKAVSKKARSKKADGDLPAPRTTCLRATHRQTRQAGQKPKRVSALDAAAQVLAKAEKPMRAQDLIAAMAEQGLWSSPNGKTPSATLYAAMLREARDKGSASRFHKVDRGMFATNRAGA